MITLITIRDDDARIINLIQRRKLKIYILHRTHALSSGAKYISLDKKGHWEYIH